MSVLRERILSCCQLHYYEPKAPDIRLGIIGFPRHSFWGHVPLGPQKGLAELVRVVEFFHYSEISQFHFSPRVYQDVSWLDISVNLVSDNMKVHQSLKNLEINKGI